MKMGFFFIIGKETVKIIQIIVSECFYKLRNQFLYRLVLALVKSQKQQKTLGYTLTVMKMGFFSIIEKEKVKIIEYHCF